VDFAVEVLGAEDGRFIDFGCGAGAASAALQEKGFAVTGVDHVDARRHAIDFVQACLWDLPPLKADYGFCADVMEHIPFEKVESVIAGIKAACPKVFFNIHTKKDGFGPKLLGEPLHLTVREPDWWHMKIKGEVVKRTGNSVSIHWQA
jgi:SAM-dependent methyltransferase